MVRRLIILDLEDQDWATITSALDQILAVSEGDQDVQHLTDDEILAYVTDKLPIDSDAERIQQHVSDCNECADLVNLALDVSERLGKHERVRSVVQLMLSQQ